MFTVFNAGGYIVAGFLYQKNPSLTPYQLVFVRSSFSIVYLIFFSLKDAPRIFYHEMERKYLVPLVFRSVQSTVSSLINMIAVLHIDIVIVSLVNNTIPIFVCLLAMCFLGERLKRVEVFFMALTFGSVIMIILGAGEGSGSQTFKDAPWAYILLFCNPAISAAG